MIPAAVLHGADNLKQSKPNIVFILADDLGYGDIGCYGATRVKTPNLDRLAKGGLRFLDGHSAAATCTPSRYALMTGEYAFRRKGTHILPGDAALVVPTDRATLPAILKKAGYSTGVVGKWHLGLGDTGSPIAWNDEIKPGPREVGFDYSFIMAATGDRVPCVYIENQRIVGLDPADPIEVNYKKPFEGEPNGITDRDKLRHNWSHGHNNAVVNGIGRIGFMKGGNAALWKDEEMSDAFTRRGVQFIERHQKEPFFLYFATHGIHVPRIPHPRFVHATEMGARGDAIVEFDAAVGELLDTLDRLKLTENTLVIVSSDNGPVLDDGYQDDAVENLGGHKPAGALRGGKGTLWEGATRLPFIVSWPGRIRPGVSNALVCQVDLCASFAALVGVDLGRDDAPDSFNVLPSLLGDSKTGRDHLVEHAGRLALRQGEWKLIGTDNKNPSVVLYNLTNDPTETTNVAEQNPDVTARLTERLNEIATNQRTRP
jgi:arylsulfatase A-like enzyme